MRIAILACILSVLLVPSLGSAAAEPVTVPLRPVPGHDRSSGIARLMRQGTRTTLMLDLRGVSAGIDRARPSYVVWLAADGQLLNAGVLAADGAGNATGILGPLPVRTAGAIVAISAEPRADVAAPTAPRDTILVSGQLPTTDATEGRLTAFAHEFGPDWLAPLIPAALGFALLRQAGRTRTAGHANAADTASPSGPADGS